MSNHSSLKVTKIPRKPGSKNFHPQLLEMIIEKFNRGEKVAQIARDLRMSHQSVSAVIERGGGGRRRKKWSETKNWTQIVAINLDYSLLLVAFRV